MTPPATHFDSDFSDDYPSKRSRADSYGHDSSDHDHTQIPPGAPEDSYSHRKTLPGRAAISNAADSIHFIKSRALVFHFVDIFDIVPDSLGKLESCILRCGICRKGNGWKWIKGGKGRGSTSNMIAHMRDKHGPIWQNALRADQAASGLIYAPETGSSTSDVQPLVTSNNEPEFHVDELYRRITRWIVTSNQPFTEVENKEFQDILTYLKPALQGHLLQSQAIRDRVFSYATSLRQSTKQYLNSLPGLMAIACDAWTSPNRIAFLAIVGSWITHDWRLEETLLDFVELHGAHDGQNMATAVASAVKELGVEEKLVALVSDNAANNGTLVRHLSTALERSSPARRWDRNKGHIRCLSHVIHLAVMSLLRGAKAVPPATDIRAFNPGDELLTAEEAETFVAGDNKEANEKDDSVVIDPTVDLASAVDKVRKITKIVRSSPQRMELFRTSAEQIEDYYEQQAMAANKPYTRKPIKNLILDVVTRWNSVYFMLERALEFSEAIDALTSHPKVKIFRQYALSKDDWGAVSHVCGWLEYFRSASTLMAAEKYPTLSFSLRIYFVLISYTSRLEEDLTIRRYPSMLPGIRACKEKLLEFFDKSTYDSEYYYFATILDPRFKDTLFKSGDSGQYSATSLFSEDWVSDCANALHDTCNEFYASEHSGYSQPEGTVQIIESGSKPRHGNLFSQDWKGLWPSRTTYIPPSNSSSSEISRYLQEEVTTLSPLKWWRLNAHRFPRLAAMARDYLCIPGTSVAVERVFSAGRDVISVRRASLSAETIRVLMTYRADIMLEKKIESLSLSD